ncbi:unnamed protein product [Blumeria hordei]|uniref:Uncharacterized protein n=1 Tax=Blumeria hordei TaxID=2867405 RepID=A0A383UYE4_BLUHO|nr:unnamed protein product [Blumeria hordei]
MAYEKAAHLLGRMRMGENQYFSDYVHEYELRLLQCGGTNWSDRTKIIFLEIGINEPLGSLLLKNPPRTNNYKKWITSVKKMANQLEKMPLYRPRKCAGKKTWFIEHVEVEPQKIPRSTSTPGSISSSAIEKVKMGNLSSINMLREAIRRFYEC